MQPIGSRAALLSIIPFIYHSANRHATNLTVLSVLLTDNFFLMKPLIFYLSNASDFAHVLCA